MHCAQYTKLTGAAWQPALPERACENFQLAIVFGSPDVFSDELLAIKACFPNATIIGCSTAGEIADTRVFDDGLVLTLVNFEYTRLKCTYVQLDDAAQSETVANQICSDLIEPDLKHIVVLSDGLNVNGTRLASGFNRLLPATVLVTGGLAGDGARFQHTSTFCNDGILQRQICALGFYGKRLRVGHGSMGGWDSFGPDRRITRAIDNVLYELDGQSALALYKRYLGEYAERLPGSALLFPLSVQTLDSAERVVRTVLSVNESDQSMVFAGDMPTGGLAKMMRANFDRLIDGAAGAAEQASDSITTPSQLAILISCVGRKMVLGQRVEEELESVRTALSDRPTMCGFYSYGEISPTLDSVGCTLHNQTMTITTFQEV